MSILLFLFFPFSVSRLPPIIMFIFITGPNGTPWTSRTSWESWKRCKIMSHPKPQHLSTYKDFTRTRVTVKSLTMTSQTSIIRDPKMISKILPDIVKSTSWRCTAPHHWGALVVSSRSLKRLFLCRGRQVNPEKLENVDLLGLRFADCYCCKLHMALHI